MNTPKSPLRRPPGPDSAVALGVDAATLATLQSLRSDFGNMVAVEKPNGRLAYFVNDAAEVRKLLVRHHTRYVKGPGFERVKMLLGNGLIVSDGDVWRRSRTMIQPAFSRQNIHSLIDLMVECATERERHWTRVAGENGELNITQEMSEFALELILRATFGPDYESYIAGEGENPFAFLSKDSARDLGVVMKARNLRALLLEIIAARRGRKDDGDYDFLAVYLGARDKQGQGFSDEELLDELITLIVAGYETSAGTLNWAWYLLSCNPSAEETLLAEARSAMSGDVDNEVLGSMTYAQQLLEETLRLYPPVWIFSRRAIADDELSEYDVPAGTDVYLSPYVLHRNPEYWPDPERFDPERFGEAMPYRKGDRPYFPFSLGPRRCLGEYFSFLEMKVHLGLLIQKFHMTLVTHEMPELDLGINLRTANDIYLRPELRETQ